MSCQKIFKAQPILFSEHHSDNRYKQQWGSFLSKRSVSGTDERMQNDAVGPRIILASKSPRRKYLLKQAGLSFAVVPSHFDERSVIAEDPEILVTILAEKKARRIARQYPKSWVIGADTIVLIHGEILGKPATKEEAREMIKRLSGQTHQVYTGFAVRCDARNKLFSAAVKTDVRFKRLSNVEIEWYIQTDEPFDKAGAYAIQGLGTFLVKSIHGSYTNVVGLPVCEVVEYLIQEGAIGPAAGNKWDLVDDPS
jgi:septum formation protein